ncbi:ClpXP protease specificity-enhancing factor SspB [Pseudovibrio exalbescens]|uniref:SspB family protein n=1 Tax=Pseudovibrio exalbescens TaxID=197461 RepID=UPI002365EAA2|nr:ClpXP protease specificity-enhancing factor SspB [Pseudovibrio exalbescens]MDD7910344.1 ClpXP protease specificity-enhancing factor SspB [Pseudovibrio exalbescens]
MAEDLIRYDIIIQDALRGAVRKILTEVNRAGLPGEHHFYIAFETTAPGVKISTRLKERYPKEMTIVLQHQFWDLQVTEHAFEVGLSFGGVPERLYVPFAAIKGFFDPSVQFALEFEPGKTAEELPEEFRIAEADLAAVEELHNELERAERLENSSKYTQPEAEQDQDTAEVGNSEADKDDKPAEAGNTVVSLDAFRKKT